MSMAFPSRVNALMQGEVPTRGSPQLRGQTSCLERLRPTGTLQMSYHRVEKYTGILLSFLATCRVANKSVRGFSSPPRKTHRRISTTRDLQLAPNASSSTKLYGFLSNDLQPEVNCMTLYPIFKNKN